MLTKVCIKCGKEFPATLEHFYANRNSLSGKCKKCMNEYSYLHKIAMGGNKRTYLADLPGELWRDIILYKGWYCVSNCGRIKRIKAGAGTFSGKVLSVKPAGCVYPQVALWKNGSYRRFYIHRLVAAAFIGLRPEDKEVNHKDGDKTNNRLDNLEYVTPVENMEHARKIGLVSQRGEDSPHSKLTEANVHEIRRLLGKETQETIAKRYGVSRTAISKIATGIRWGWLKEEEEEE